MAGIDPARFLSCDPFEMRAVQLVAARRAELDRTRDENLAVLIANKVGERLGV